MTESWRIQCEKAANALVEKAEWCGCEIDHATQFTRDGKAHFAVLKVDPCRFHKEHPDLPYMAHLEQLVNKELEAICYTI
jgi:hypothetical protein